MLSLDETLHDDLRIVSIMYVHFMTLSDLHIPNLAWSQAHPSHQMFLGPWQEASAFVRTVQMGVAKRYSLAVAA